MVYFVQGHTTRLIKIGWSKSPSMRFDNLQCGSPDKLVILKEIETSEEAERYLHLQFKDLRQHGEWFYPGERLLKFIADVPRIANTAVIAEMLADPAKQAELQGRDAEWLTQSSCIVSDRRKRDKISPSCELRAKLTGDA